MLDLGGLNPPAPARCPQRRDHRRGRLPAGGPRPQLAQHGRALRLVPSTYRTASLGGFLAGGSGGIGSLRWGFLRDPGQLLGCEIVTVEPEPRLLSLDAAASAPLNHAYGTNGILTALTLATTEAVAWEQLVVASPAGPTP